MALIPNNSDNQTLTSSNNQRSGMKISDVRMCGDCGG
uniref:Uncharacterized protein n=1 Tax=Tetranychus urticae TaxID=32264 RepID=T1JYG2_TETUR